MKTVRVYAGFACLPASYDALFSQAGAHAGFFFSRPWFSHLAATALEEGVALRIYGIETAQSDAEPQLALPMLQSKSTGRFGGPRRLTAAANFYSSLFGPVADHDAAALSDNLRLLSQAIAAERPSWDMVDIHPMASEDAAYGMMACALRQAGFAVQRYFCFGNWYLRVDGRTYQQYCNTLPSKLKNTLRRKSRQLAKTHAANFKILSGQAEVQEATAAFLQVYQSSWKQAETFPDFVPGLIQLCAQQGWLRMGVVYIDGRPVAAQLWIVSHGVAAIYKLAYDERFAAFSIGSLLTAHLMAHVMDVDRVAEVDYLTGDDAYKQDWMSHRRERWGLVAFNLRTARGLLATGRHLGGHALRNFWRRLHLAG